MFDNSRIDVPLGLAFALAQNEKAMEYFASLTSVHKQEIIDRTHAVNSKQEMQEFVDSLI